MEDSEKDSNIEVHSFAKNDDDGNKLKRKYFCEVKENQMDVVVELSVDEKVTKSKIPRHFIIVMDVSASMSKKMHQSTGTLLESVQFFAQLLVKNLNFEDWLSIVTFNNNANASLTKTKMDEQGKTRANTAISEMIAKGGTNLSEGLMKALEISNKGCQLNLTRDVILLFTDGKATNGITNADRLVDRYNEKTAHSPCKIPLAAMTMGDYKPDFLSEIASRLGGDAFYWLKEDSDFEADMFTPVFLRSTTGITDISLKISCADNDVTIVKDKFSPEYLQSKGVKYAVPNAEEGGLNDQNGQASAVNLIWKIFSKMSNITSKSEEVGDIVELNYFVFELPSSMTKNILFSLNLPEDKMKLNETIIFNVATTFFDENMESHTCEDNLQLFCEHTMKRKQLEDKTARIDETNNVKAQEILSSHSAYTMQAGIPGTTWHDAKEAFCKVLQEQSKRNVIEALKEGHENLESPETDLSSVFEKAIEVCQTMENTIKLVLGEKDEFTELIKVDIKKDIGVLESSKSLVCNDQIKPNLKWVMLRSREISLAKEMPSTSTVFDLADNESQPFMPKPIRKQLVSIQKDVHENAIQRKRKPYRAWITD